MIKVILDSGKEVSLTEWQLLYDIIAGSPKIGKYFSLTERKFQADLKEFGKLYVCAPLIEVADEFRARWGKPLTVNSFNRSKEKQEALRKAGARAAAYSPHEVYLAMDIDTPGIDDILKIEPKLTRQQAWERAIQINRDMVQVLKKVGKDLNFKIRIGSETYLKDGDTFIHLDVCPEYYGKGKPWESRPHPPQWKNELYF
jgi:hypothetical protein